MGRPDLLNDPRLATNALRVEARTWLIPEIQSILARWSKAELVEFFERRGIVVAVHPEA